MYRPRYLSLHEAVKAVADHLAKADLRANDSTASASDAAVNQLVQALYDGVIRSEGVYRDITPIPYEDTEYTENLPLQRRSISNQLWSNEKHHRIKRDERGRHSELDVITVSWDDNNIYWKNEYQEPHLYEHIRLYSSDLAEQGFLKSPIPSSERPAGDEEVNSSDPGVDPHGPVEMTYSTGAPGRRTSMHIIELEMRRRFEGGEQMPTMRAEAEDLSQWLSKTHPGAAPTTPKTIQNHLGDRYKQLKAAIPK